MRSYRCIYLRTLSPGRWICCRYSLLAQSGMIIPPEPQFFATCRIRVHFQSCKKYLYHAPYCLTNPLMLALEENEKSATHYGGGDNMRGKVEVVDVPEFLPFDAFTQYVFDDILEGLKIK